MKKKLHAKHRAWFVRVRNSYLPQTWQGMSIYLLYVAYIIAVPVLWYRNGHDAWKLLTTVLPLVALAVILAQYIARKNSH